MYEKKKLVLVGGGGHCKSVLDTAMRMKLFDEIVITDPGLPVGYAYSGMTVVGEDKELPRLFDEGFRYAFLSVGSVESAIQRRRVFEKLESKGFQFPNIIDPSALVSESSTIGRGIFIGKNAVINACSTIGDMAIVNTAAVVEHDCKIGDFSHISINATACGNVTIENDAFIGAGSIVIQGVRIGESVVVGAGSIILKSVPSHQKIYGIYKG